MKAEKNHKITTIFTQKDDFFSNLIDWKKKLLRLYTTIIFFSAWGKARDSCQQPKTHTDVEQNNEDCPLQSIIHSD